MEKNIEPALALIVGILILIRPALLNVMPPQENLWVNFGSGRAPSVWYNATSSP